MVPSETACTSVSEKQKLQGSGSLPILLRVPPPPKTAARYILLQSLEYTGPLRDNDFLLLFFPLHLSQSNQIGKGKRLLEAGESRKCSGGSSKCPCSCLCKAPPSRVGLEGSSFPNTFCLPPLSPSGLSRAVSPGRINSSSGEIKE